MDPQGGEKEQFHVYNRLEDAKLSQHLKFHLTSIMCAANYILHTKQWFGKVEGCARNRLNVRKGKINLISEFLFHSLFHFAIEDIPAHSVRIWYLVTGSAGFSFTPFEKGCVDNISKFAQGLWFPLLKVEAFICRHNIWDLRYNVMSKHLPCRNFPEKIRSEN